MLAAFILFIIIVLTIILALLWLFTKKKIFGEAIGYLGYGVIVLVALGLVINFCENGKRVKRSDYTGQYVINRKFYAGKQADWQYEHFRFEIKSDDAIEFHVTEKDRIVKTYYGTVSTSHYDRTERLIINMNQPTHHIMSSNPTLYRGVWNFILVFQSPKFRNVCFKKAQWTPIEHAP